MKIASVVKLFIEIGFQNQDFISYYLSLSYHLSFFIMYIGNVALQESKYWHGNRRTIGKLPNRFSNLR